MCYTRPTQPYNDIKIYCVNLMNTMCKKPKISEDEHNSYYVTVLVARTCYNLRVLTIQH